VIYVELTNDLSCMCIVSKHFEKRVRVLKNVDFVSFVSSVVKNDIKVLKIL